jgi:hypothetical protein
MCVYIYVCTCICMYVLRLPANPHQHACACTHTKTPARAHTHASTFICARPAGGAAVAACSRFPPAVSRIPGLQAAKHEVHNGNNTYILLRSQLRWNMLLVTTIPHSLHQCACAYLPIQPLPPLRPHICRCPGVYGRGCGGPLHWHQFDGDGAGGGGAAGVGGLLWGVVLCRSCSYRAYDCHNLQPELAIIVAGEEKLQVCVGGGREGRRTSVIYIYIYIFFIIIIFLFCMHVGIFSVHIAVGH